MFIEKSIFSKEDLTLAIQLAKSISWFLKQRDRLGPFPSENGWHVATGICNTCGGVIKGSVYKDRNEAVKVAEDIVKKMAMDDIEMLQIYGPINGLCDDCKEKFRYAEKLEKKCNTCGRDCSGCSIYREFEDLFD